MLLGLLITILWIPGQEHNADGDVKTLEEWEVGRDSNGFDKVWLAKIITPVYHKVAKVWDKFYMWFDGFTGGDLAERRQREEEEEIEEMEDMGRGETAE